MEVMAKKELSDFFAAGAKEVGIPYQSIVGRYGNLVAAIIATKADSDAAEETRAAPASKIRWSVAYILPDDPAESKDADEFVAKLIGGSRFALIGRFNRWNRGIEMIGEPPPQVVNRYRERAELIYHNGHAAVTPTVSTDATAPTAIGDDINELLRQLAAFGQKYPDADPGYLAVCRMALRAMVASYNSALRCKGD